MPDLSGDGEVGSGRKGDARRHAAGYGRGCGPNSRVAQRRCSSPSTRERSDVRIVGTNDNLIRPEWTEAAVERACADGDVIEFQARPGEGHADGAAVPGAVAWVKDRFAGVPAPNTCGS